MAPLSPHARLHLRTEISRDRERESLLPFSSISFHYTIASRPTLCSTSLFLLLSTLEYSCSSYLPARVSWSWSLCWHCCCFEDNSRIADRKFQMENGGSVFFVRLCMSSTYRLLTNPRGNFKWFKWNY